MLLNEMVDINNKTFDKVDNFDWTQLYTVKDYVNPDNIDEQGLFCARFRGSLYSLFGQPTVDNKDIEDGVYEYNLRCTDKITGDSNYFNITELRLGPVLSAADNSLTSKGLGQILWDKILVTHPSDFKAKYFDDENALKVYYGYENGSPFFELKPFNPFDYLRFLKMIVSR